MAFVGGIGHDPEGERARSLFDDIAVDRRGLVVLTDRPTTRKTRVVAHNQQVVRADWESTAPLSTTDRALAVARVVAAVADADAVVLSDYGKGFLSREIVEAALACPLVIADPKPENVAMFAGVNCVAPNVSEAARATGIAIVDSASLELAGRTLLNRLGCHDVIITRGEAACRCSAEMENASTFRRSRARFSMSAARAIRGRRLNAGAGGAHPD